VRQLRDAVRGAGVPYAPRQRPSKATVSAWSGPPGGTNLTVERREVRAAPRLPIFDLGGGMVSVMDQRAAPSSVEARRAADAAARFLAEDPRVILVYVFGSGAQPGAHRARDVDIGILADPPFTIGELMRRRADLVAATGVSVDLVSLNEAPISLAHEVVDGGVCLFARTPDAETEFVTRSRRRYWDFKPYRETQWRLTGERAAQRRRGP
jgi:predicted nucleotidyltransferase